MDTFVVISLVGVALLLAELLLPTGGVLAVLGALGLIAAGVVALESGNDAADIIGPALITLGILSAITFFLVARKVLSAHRDEPVLTGSEELLGASAEVRSSLDPEGQVWLQGALWGARLADPSSRVRPGDKVRVEAVEGLTLVVRAQPPAAEPSGEGAS
jgi:membrane-bound serine protease (ClpP class)